MKSRLMLLGLVIVLGGAVARAEEPAPVTLQGEMMCGKCTLHEGKKCSDVLMVKEGDKEVRYNVVLTSETKGAHVCSGKKAVKVTGIVSEKDGQKVITATKVEPA